MTRGEGRQGSDLQGNLICRDWRRAAPFIPKHRPWFHAKAGRRRGQGQGWSRGRGRGRGRGTQKPQSSRSTFPSRCSIFPQPPAATSKIIIYLYTCTSVRYLVDIRKKYLNPGGRCFACGNSPGPYHHRCAGTSLLGKGRYFPDPAATTSEMSQA
jgi:hypothetical protein